MEQTNNPMPKRRGRPPKDPNAPRKPKNDSPNKVKQVQATKEQKELAMSDPAAKKMRDVIPILPEEREFVRMTIAEIADYINAIPENRIMSKIAAFQIAVQNIAINADDKDMNSMRKCFYAFCALAEATNMKVGNMTAYAAMGITQGTANEWRKGGVGSTPERRQLIEEVCAVCGATREMLGASGAINPVLTIFWQKNWDGFRDVTEHVAYQGDPLGEKQSPNEIAERYKDIIDE